MKKILFAALMAMISFTFTSCDGGDNNTSDEGLLDVTAYNIAGEWELSTWMGAPLAEGNYVRINFKHSDRTFTMWQNVDSAPERTITGRFYIDTTNGKAVIRGLYDYGVGEWNHRYIITRLTETEMEWVALDNPEDITTYKKVI